MAGTLTTISPNDLVKKLMDGERDFSSTRMPSGKSSLQDQEGYSELNEYLRGQDLRSDPVSAEGSDWRGLRARGFALQAGKLAGINLSNADLRGADFRRGEFTNADLHEADLAGAFLSNARSQEADLTGAVLRGADLYEANLTGASLRGADLTRAVLLKVPMKDADVTGAVLTDAIMYRADLRGVVGLDAARDLGTVTFYQTIVTAVEQYLGLVGPLDDHGGEPPEWRPVPAPPRRRLRGEEPVAGAVGERHHHRVLGGSGIYHANWIHSGCVLMDGGQAVMDEDGDPVVLIGYVPKEAIDLKDNWDVLGLRGTGSFDYSIADEIFVPDYRTYVYSKNFVERGGPRYSLGIVGFTAWGHTSFALGVGRHALDELATIAKTKAGPFGILADSPSFKEKYARAEAQYRSVRALVYAAWNDVDETLEREEPASLEQIALLKLGFRYAHEVMSEICTFAYHGGGGVALRSSPLQRCYRDLHAGLQHVLLSDQIMQDCGTVLMGHAREGARWELLGLKEPDE